MPEEEDYEDNGHGYPVWGLDHIVLDDMKKGKIVTSPPSWDKDVADTIHYDIMHIREAWKEIEKVYKEGGSRKDFVKVLEKRRKKKEDDLHDWEGRIENFRNEKAFRVVERKKKGNKITLTFEEIDEKDKTKYVKNIVKKLIGKVSREQLEAMFEQSIMKMNDLDVLKKVDKALDKEDPKLEGKRGCYKLVVEGVDLWLLA